MRLLLDTNALVRWHLKKLRPAAVRTVERAELVVVSAISAWEIAIKGPVGKLDLKTQLKTSSHGIVFSRSRRPCVTATCCVTCHATTATRSIAC